MRKKSRKPKSPIPGRGPKGPCDPEPPRRPPEPRPAPPWDRRPGPDPLKWLKIERKG